MGKKKEEDIVALANRLIGQGSYIISKHAQARQAERTLNIGDIKNAIRTGYHEKKKDEYKEAFLDWNYAIRGKSLDNESARICIAFSKRDSMVIVTVIRLEN